MSRFHYLDPKESERDPFDTASEPDATEFEELLKLQPATSGTVKSFRMGDKANGPVLRVTSEYIFVDLGGKNAGSLTVDEFKSAYPDKPLPVVGDVVDAFVKKDNGSEILLTIMIGRTDPDIQSLLLVYQNHLPIEAKIDKYVKGGFEASIGRRRAFIPLSQIELSSVSEPEKYVGQLFQFIITEFSNGGRNIILSRRVLLANERKRLGDEILATLDVGHAVKATIMRLAPIGAFVDIGGIDALIPLSEMSWKKVKRPEDVVKVGEIVDAKVIRLEREPKLRIALSMKDASDSAALELYKAQQGHGKNETSKPDGGSPTGLSDPSSHDTLAQAFAKAISHKSKQ